jgi:hypothetical protein
MATDLTKVRVAVSGAVYRGVSAEPAGTAGAPAGATDLGAVSDDGVELQIPGEGDSTPVKQWDGSVVRTIRSPSEDLPTWKVTFLESNKDVVETTFGVTITASTTDGSFEYKVTNRDADGYVFDYIDGTNLTRDFVPVGTVVDIDAQTYANTDATRYTVTITGELDPTLGYNFTRFSTAWKS